MDGLALSTSKKRKRIDESGEAHLTPKRARISHATPSTVRTVPRDLPPHLARLLDIYNALEQSMSLALATGQIAPDPNTGRVPAVLNHLGIVGRGMGRMRMGVDDLRRLCWVWEWGRDTEHETPSSQDTELILSQRTTRTRMNPDTSMRSAKIVKEDEADEPFLVKAQMDDPFVETPRYWIRGGSGFIITPATHLQKNAATGTSKRAPVYGIGIEVDWAQEDVAGGRVGGMGAVARWTAAGETRKCAFKEKLERWIEMCSPPTSKLPTTAPPATKSKLVGVTPLEADSSIPVIPFADLPTLPELAKTYRLSRPPNIPSRTGSLLSTTSRPVNATPSDKDDVSPFKDGFMIPFLVAPGSRPIMPSGNHALSTSLPRSGGIRTPSFGRAAAAKAAAETTPSSRAAKIVSGNGRVTSTFSLKKPIGLTPEIPTHQRGNYSEPSSTPGTNSKSASNTGVAKPETPTSARRRALYERIRTKSEPESSDKRLITLITPEKLRRRCILGRLGGVAEAVWMLFTSPVISGLTSSGRKRRAIRQVEVVRAVVKSANPPISDAEAVESLEMLCELCPCFLKRRVIEEEDWLEMPATTGDASMGPGAGPNASPAARARPRHMDGLPGVMGSPRKVRASEEELLARSTRRIKKEEGGLRQVREIIRRELEVDGDGD